MNGDGTPGGPGGNLCTAKILPGFRRTVLYRLPNGNDKRVVYFLAEFEHQEAHQNPEEFLKVMVLPYREALRALTFENDPG